MYRALAVTCISLGPRPESTAPRPSPWLAPEPVQGHPGGHAWVVVQNRLEHLQQWHVCGVLHERCQDLVKASCDAENLRLHIGAWIAHASFGFDQNDGTQ